MLKQRSPMKTRMPIFPLDVVLLPGTVLPLHIFEPRYKLMIRRCLNLKQPFGVVLQKRGGLATVGCAAEITALLKEYPDGRMDILTRGELPFAIEKVFEDQPYFEAAVEWLRENQQPSCAAPQELMELYEQCYWLLFNRPPDRRDAKCTSQAYAMADALPLPLHEKQALLETRDESRRQDQLLGKLKEWMPQLASLNERRQRARGNGFSLN